MNELWRISPCIRMLAVEFFASTNIVLAAVDKDAVPTEVQREVGAVAVDAVGSTDVNECTDWYSKHSKDKKQLSVFFELREAPKSGFAQWRYVARNCKRAVVLEQMSLGDFRLGISLRLGLQAVHQPSHERCGNLSE